MVGFILRLNNKNIYLLMKFEKVWNIFIIIVENFRILEKDFSRNISFFLVLLGGLY